MARVLGSHVSPLLHPPCHRFMYIWGGFFSASPLRASFRLLQLHAIFFRSKFFFFRCNFLSTCIFCINFSLKKICANLFFNAKRNSTLKKSVTPGGGGGGGEKIHTRLLYLAPSLGFLFSTTIECWVPSLLYFWAYAESLYAWTENKKIDCWGMYPPIIFFQKNEIILIA